ncbi:XRE family transcriptional regulator [Vineibacter terrae]|uniref:XRE family transcriptional regulator n=1 Tax=Vineibacter terrae TaxID=2586908 RepID=UPI002E352211|nr:XRE family transcriptional regulator [Vineibacter terrae]HEX2889207.1 XRE family transcriptional regulator [Vineibacter terrae]
MTGHRPFKELTQRFSAQRRARVAAKAAAPREAMTLEELRKAHELSQEQLAELLCVGQPAVAKLEKRTDMHVSNLRRYIEALGGTLEITAHFADGRVAITSLGETPEAQ